MSQSPLPFLRQPRTKRRKVESIPSTQALVFLEQLPLWTIWGEYLTLIDHCRLAATCQTLRKVCRAYWALPTVKWYQYHAGYDYTRQRQIPLPSLTDPGLFRDPLWTWLFDDGDLDETIPPTHLPGTCKSWGLWLALLQWKPELRSANENQLVQRAIWQSERKLLRDYAWSQGLLPITDDSIKTNIAIKIATTDALTLKQWWSIWNQLQITILADEVFLRLLYQATPLIGHSIVDLCLHTTDTSSVWYRSWTDIHYGLQFLAPMIKWQVNLSPQDPTFLDLVAIWQQQIVPQIIISSSPFDLTETDFLENCMRYPSESGTKLLMSLLPQATCDWSNYHVFLACNFDNLDLFQYLCPRLPDLIQDNLRHVNRSTRILTWWYDQQTTIVSPRLSPYDLLLLLNEELDRVAPEVLTWWAQFDPEFWSRTLAVIPLDTMKKYHEVIRTGVSRFSRTDWIQFMLQVLERKHFKLWCILFQDQIQREQHQRQTRHTGPLATYLVSLYTIIPHHVPNHWAFQAIQYGGIRRTEALHISLIFGHSALIQGLIYAGEPCRIDQLSRWYQYSPLLPLLIPSLLWGCDCQVERCPCHQQERVRYTRLVPQLD